VILYFYPKDNTPGCTVQACNLRDNYQTLLEQGYVVIGVSQDTSISHKKFIAKQNLPFPLIADTDHTVHNLFGVWAEKKMYGKTYMGTLRTTFVINGEGVIDEVIAKVKTKEHTAQILG
jgi:peroxiredoxin Q/BCP